MITQILRWNLRLTLVVLAALAATIFLAAPSSLGPFGITLWFVGLLVAATGVGIWAQSWWRPPAKSQQLSSYLRRSLLFAVVLTTVLALSSLRQLSWRDIILITIIAALVNFYLRRTVIDD